MFKNSASALFIAHLLLIAGCSSLADNNSDNTETDAKASTSVDSDLVNQHLESGGAVMEVTKPTDDLENTELPLPEAEILYGTFSEDILSRVILAEMAGQRGLNQQVLNEYIALAQETGDINIIKRASRIATYTRDISASIKMANMWLELEPDAEEAHQTLAFQMISQGRYGQALNHLTTLLDLGTNVDFRLISTQAALDENAPLILDALIADFKDLHQRYPENLSLFLSLAHLYQQNNQIQEAYEAVTALASQMDDAPEVVILEVQLLEHLGQGELANERLEQSLRTHTEHKQLRLLYGRKLVDERRFDEAQQQFNIIVEQNPDDYDMIYSLALISMEVNRYNDAKRSFESLIGYGQRLDDAHFYLAYISTQQNEPDQAIEHYLQVKSGSNFLPAQRNVTELMVQAGRYAEASSRLQSVRFRNADYNIVLLTMEANILIEADMQAEAATFLDNTIGAFPNNIQLVYLRSVLSQQLGNFVLMEQDLRKVIQLDPGNPIAYNTLGYFLTDSTTRYEEAYELILRAIQLSPDDPAIIDSLGWVQYHLGLYEQAKTNLERAFEQFPDHEVAAHLGEVLWVLGNTQEANQIWQKALETQPDSEYILNAMERLIVTPDT